jgi:hypothetical protein
METANFSDPDSFKQPIQPPITAMDSLALSQQLGDLIRAGEKDKARALLEAELLKGIRSGPPEPWTDQDLADIRAEVLRRHEERIAQRNLPS